MKTETEGSFSCTFHHDLVLQMDAEDEMQNAFIRLESKAYDNILPVPSPIPKLDFTTLHVYFQKELCCLEKLEPNSLGKLRELQVSAILELHEVGVFKHDCMRLPQFQQDFVRARTLCTFNFKNRQRLPHLLYCLLDLHMLAVSPWNGGGELALVLLSNSTPPLGQYVEPPLALMLFRQAELLPKPSPLTLTDLELPSSPFPSHLHTVVKGIKAIMLGSGLEITSQKECEWKTTDNDQSFVRDTERIAELANELEKAKRIIAIQTQELATLAGSNVAFKPALPSPTFQLASALTFLFLTNIAC